jgi:putative membrane protein
VALLITANIVPGFFIKNFFTALIATLIIGLVNAFVRPILGFLTFPITLITFGLFTFVLNALTLWLASVLTPGFEIRDIWAALLGSIVLAVVSSAISYLMRSPD